MGIINLKAQQTRDFNLDGKDLPKIKETVNKSQFNMKGMSKMHTLGFQRTEEDIEESLDTPRYSNQKFDTLQQLDGFSGRILNNKGNQDISVMSSFENSKNQTKNMDQLKNINSGLVFEREIENGSTNNQNTTINNVNNILQDLDNKLEKRNQLVIESLDRSNLDISKNVYKEIDSNLNFILELESKNNRLIIAETGNSNMKILIEKEILSIKSQIKSKEEILNFESGNLSTELKHLKCEYVKLADVNEQISRVQGEIINYNLVLGVLKNKTLPELEQKLHVMTGSLEECREEESLNKQKIDIIGKKIVDLNKQILEIEKINEEKTEEISSKKEMLKKILRRLVDVENQNEKLLIEEQIMKKKVSDFNEY